MKMINNFSSFAVSKISYCRLREL